jgi:putative addiction module component (TIGR02574 family)
VTHAMGEPRFDFSRQARLLNRRAGTQLIRLLISPCQRGETALGYKHMSDLREQINSLSPAEKAELLDTVWESLEADAVSMTDAQRAELDYRISRHEQNPSDVIGWQQVRAGLFKKP